MFQQKLQGRRWPSEEKLNYLLHLDDCRHDSCTGIGNAVLLLGRIEEYVRSDPTDIDPALLLLYQDLSGDLKSLQKHLEEIAALIADLRGMVSQNLTGKHLTLCSQCTQAYTLRQIKDQIDLRQIRLTGVLTFLAAIYVPFSFISVGTPASV